MEFKDKQIKCRECGLNFDFSAAEQMYFQEKGLTNEPKRCNNCRVLLRLLRSGRDVTSATTVCCAKCNQKTTVPFLPTGYKPVYCVPCLQDARVETPLETLQLVGAGLAS